MTTHARRLFDELARRQHGVAAVWQLLDRVPRTAVDRWIRLDRPERVHRGVYGAPEGNVGRAMAAVLAAGPSAVLSHRSGLALWAMREWSEDGTVTVSVPGNGGCADRDGFRVHRSSRLAPTLCLNVPVNTPTRCLLDAALPRHEAYRALEAAEQARLRIDHGALNTPALRQVREVLRLGENRTRSDPEARFIFLCRDRRIEMPIVNAMLNGVEADFHWPRAQLVVEVDGWRHHRDRRPFEEDRRRGLVHRIAGFEVVRVSAGQVQRTPRQVIAAVLAAAPYLQAR